MGSPITVVLADDSALMRKKIKEMLERDPHISVVGAARNGQEAVDLVKQHEPSVVTMDINMPVMDGITALQVIMMESPRPVIMLSSLTQEGALTTFECLELGAVDFIGKPSGTISLDIEMQADEILAKVRTAARSKPGTRLRRKPARDKRPNTSSGRPTPASDGAATQVVAIGVSTGGPKTLLDVLPYLPADLDAAVLIVQHMPAAFTKPFAQRLNDNSTVPIKESEPGDILMTGKGYLARGGTHMTFAKRGLGCGAIIRHTIFPNNKPHIPSVDVMMDSAAEMFGRNVVGVLLTGMGDDGADAMVHIRRAGGRTIAEDESTCVVFGMPAQAIARGGAEFVLPVYDIAQKIVELVGAGALARS
jgi:two-component system chemotaxis response regulator CheB